MNVRDGVASALYYSGIVSFYSLAMRAATVKSSTLRVVNYHGVPARFRQAFIEQLERLCERAVILHPEDLVDFHAGRRFFSGTHLLLTFDDGLRNHYEVVADCLEARGLRGLFFVPVGFADSAAGHRARQISYFRANIRAHPDVRHVQPEDLLPMDWTMIRDLAKRGHVIGAHTWTHQKLSEGLRPAHYRREILDAADRIEDEIGVPIRHFAWPFGDPEAYSLEALQLVRRRYAFGFSTFALPLHPGDDPHLINRINLEAGFPIPRLRLGLAGLLDFKMYPRWIGVRRRLAG